jgi:hypothetical protein
VVPPDAAGGLWGGEPPPGAGLQPVASNTRRDKDANARLDMIISDRVPPWNTLWQDAMPFPALREGWSETGDHLSATAAKA